MRCRRRRAAGRPFRRHFGAPRERADVVFRECFLGFEGVQESEGVLRRLFLPAAGRGFFGAAGGASGAAAAARAAASPRRRPRRASGASCFSGRARRSSRASRRSAGGPLSTWAGRERRPRRARGALLAREDVAAGALRFPGVDLGVAGRAGFWGPRPLMGGGFWSQARARVPAATTAAAPSYLAGCAAIWLRGAI